MGCWRDPASELRDDAHRWGLVEPLTAGVEALAEVGIDRAMSLASPLVCRDVAAALDAGPARHRTEPESSLVPAEVSDGHARLAARIPSA